MAKLILASLRNTITLASVLLLGMMALLCIALGWLTKQSISTIDYVEHIDLVVRTASVAFRDIAALDDVGRRDVDWEKDYEGGYQAAAKLGDREFEALQELVIDDPDQRSRLRKVQQIRDERELTLKEPIGHPGLRSPAVLVDHIAAEKRLSAERRSVQEEFIHDEEMRRAARVQKARKNQRGAMAAAIGLAFVISAVFLLSTRKQIRRLATSFVQSQEEVARQISCLSQANREKERVLEELEQSASYARSLIEASLDPMVTINREGKITDVNKATEAVTGISRQGLIGSDFCNYFVEPVKAREAYEHVFVAGLARDFALGIRHVSGKITPVLYNASRFKNESGQEEMVFAAARDISQRMILEDQLMEARKLEAVGRLAAGIAHDFNNIMGVILGSVELMQSELPLGKLGQDYIEDIKAMTKHGANLTQQLLTFGRKHVLSLKVWNLNEIVKEAGQFLPRIIGGNVEVEISVPEEESPVVADRVQLQQVLINLSANARDAMQEGGKLAIEVANCVVNNNGGASHLTPGHYVTLTVSDTGVGMSPQVQSRAFEPFFTTKDIGKGTGLGLPTVYGIVQQSGGSISLDSRSGEGTAIRIYLPRATEGTGVEEAASGVTEHSVSCSENVLLVEDQSRLRSLTRRFLRGLGYRVLEAGSGDEAIRLVHRFIGKIDLLLTDISLPGTNGPALAQWLRTLHPEISVLYVSGSSPEITCSENEAFLQKPFPHQELAGKIRELLEARKSASFTEEDQERAS